MSIKKSNFIILLISLLFFLNSCSTKNDNPLIIPPEFNDQPDPNNPEKNIPKNNSNELEKIKNLLLKTEE